MEYLLYFLYNGLETTINSIKCEIVGKIGEIGCYKIAEIGYMNCKLDGSLKT